MAYEPADSDFRTSRMAYSVDQAHFDQEPKARPRGTSSVRSEDGMSDSTRYLRPQQPINEAVTSAFDKTQTSIDPDLIAQITQNVINQLKTSGIQDSGTPVPQTARQFAPPPVQPVPLSPSTMSGSSPPMHTRNVYTPPSPHKNQEYSGRDSPQSQSAAYPVAPQSPQERASTSFHNRRTSSPLSQASDTSHHRPRGPMRLSTGKEETTLERIWGQLFDEDSHPTTRLGQFLRGLAIHIIEDYEPRHSLVITPKKMERYYKDVKLSNEIYPWATVFDDERSSISRMYRELECQHHLVQEHYDERPDIPGLTPVGFERWVTLLIQAHPDKEYERLQKAVLDMPINNPDDKKERFPKELSRRLFPGFSDSKIREDIEHAISEHANIDLPNRTERNNSPRPSVSDSVHSLPPPRPSVSVEPPTGSNLERERKPYVNSQPTTAPEDVKPVPTPINRRASIDPESAYIPPNNIERERKPYSSMPSESAVDDTNPFPPPPPPGNAIERERNPYSSQPVAGRAYADDLRSTEAGYAKPRAESMASNLGRSESVASKVGRSDSNARTRPIPFGTNIPNRGPMEIPKPEAHHHRQPSNVRRHRSPSFSRVRDDFRSSEGDLRGYQPTFPPGSVPIPDGFEEESRRIARERARRQAEDDARAYGESPGPRARYERPIVDVNGPPRGSNLNDEEYYRNGGRVPGNGYEQPPPYGGPAYR